PSPMADHGYDVADPRDVEPEFGDLAGFDTLVRAAHAEGLRVTIDLVPNHSSNQHSWFKAAVAAAPGSSERPRYFFRDGRRPGRRTTGSPCSAGRPGAGCRTGSGTCTCSPRSSPT